MPAPPRVAYVNQPFYAPRYTPDLSRLAELYSRGGAQLADLSMQRAAIPAMMLNRLGDLFSGFVAQKRQEKAAATALAVRATERQQDLDQKEKDRAEREAERLDAARTRKNERDEAAAVEMVNNMPPGPIEPTPENKVAVQFISQFPRAAARLRVGTTLPARPVDPSMPAMAAPEPMVSRTATGPEMERAGAVQRGIEAQRAAAEERKIDNARADLNTQRGIAAQRATEAHYGKMEDIAQQNANTTAKRYTSTGLDASNLDPTYADALDSAIMSFPQTKRRPVVDQANRAAAAGDTERVKEIIKQAALEGENVDSRNQIRSRQATIAALEDTRQMIRQLKAEGVDTSWFTGTAEDLARKLGKTTNPKLVVLKNRLMDTVIQYRRAATGVAFGEREGRDYANMFPNYSQDLPVNEATIEGLSRAMKGNDRSFWEGKLGKKGAALVTGTPDAVADPMGIRI